MLWFRKFAAPVLTSVGAALAALPFPAQLAGDRTAQVVSLEVAPAPFTEEAARTGLGERFVALTSQGLGGTW